MAIVSNKNLTPWQLRPLTTNEQAANGGYTHVASLTANDTTTTTTATAQTFTLATLKSGDIVYRVAFRLKTAFKDVSDAALNTTTLSVGQTGTTTTWISGIELNENGTEVFTGASVAVNPIVYQSANAITATLGAPPSGKAISDLDVGEVEIYVELVRAPALEKAIAATSMTK